MKESKGNNQLNTADHNNLNARKHLSAPKYPTEARPFEKLYTIRHGIKPVDTIRHGIKLVDRHVPKSFPQRERQASFPPLPEHLIRHQHSKSS